MDEFKETGAEKLFTNVEKISTREKDGYIEIRFEGITDPTRYWDDKQKEQHEAALKLGAKRMAREVDKMLLDRFKNDD